MTLNLAILYNLSTHLSNTSQLNDLNLLGHLLPAVRSPASPAARSVAALTSVNQVKSEEMCNRVGEAALDVVVSELQAVSSVAIIFFKYISFILYGVFLG